MKNKVRELEKRTIQSAKNLTEHIRTLKITPEQEKKLNSLILKHVDDCINWGIGVKLEDMLEKSEEEK